MSSVISCVGIRSVELRFREAAKGGRASRQASYDALGAARRPSASDNTGSQRKVATGINEIGALKQPLAPLLSLSVAISYRPVIPKGLQP